MSKPVVIKEEWQAAIVRKNFLTNATAFGHLCRVMYPEIEHARDRHAAALRDGGEWARTLCDRLKAEADADNAALKAWDAAQKVAA